jgi:hypothetical protein
MVIWLLLAVFALPFTAKSIHLRHIDTDCAGHAHHDSDNCPVCHFALFSFIKAEQIELSAAIPHSFTRSSVCRDKPYICFVCSCCVRGPPAA